MSSSESARHVLITGGAGFIGSHLAEALLERGDQVQSLDDLSTGSIAHIEPLKAHPHFSYVIDTVMNRPLLAELIDRADMIFHLAAAVGVRLIIGHTKDITVYDLALLVKTMTQSASEITLVPYAEAYEEGFEDMPRRLPDIARIRDLVGYQPTLDLPEMLERIIACHRAELKVGPSCVA